MMSNDQITSRTADVRNALQQYEDGAITYIEFVYASYAKITDEEFQEHEEYLQSIEEEREKEVVAVLIDLID